MYSGRKLAPSGIILFRIKGQDSKEKVKLLKKLLVSHDNKLMNHFTVITKGSLDLYTYKPYKEKSE